MMVVLRILRVLVVMVIVMLMLRGLVVSATLSAARNQLHFLYF